MIGTLFDDKTAVVVPAAVQFGGSWQDGTPEHPQAHGPDGLRWVYQRLQRHNHPLMIDVGASTGSYCLLARHHVGMEVAAFEPNFSAYCLLQQNIHANNLKSRVLAHATALSDRQGMGTLHIPFEPQQAGLAVLDGAPNRFTQWADRRVPVTMLDSAWEMMYRRPVHMVKIDTEGHEWMVLRGGQRLIAAYHPDLLLECEARNTAQHGYTPDDLTAWLTARGYELTFLGHDVAAVWSGDDASAH